MSKQSNQAPLVVTKQMLNEWTPSLEQFLPDGLFKTMTEGHQKLLVGMAFEAATNLGLTSMESGNMLALDGDNSGMARDVLLPGTGTPGVNGVAQPGTKGSADRNFVIGLAISIAAKTIGLELVQTLKATTQSVTVDYLDVKYGGGGIENPKNTNTYVVTVKFDGKRNLTKNQEYAFKTATGLTVATYVKPDKEIRDGYIFEMKSKFNADIDNDGAIANAVQVAGENLSAGLQDSTIGSVNAAFDAFSPLMSDNETTMKVTFVDITSAVVNYVPNQTTKGLRRLLTRSEADAGSDRTFELDLYNENYTVGNRTLTGNVARLQYKRLVERGIDPIPYLTNAMKNDISQEINYDIISAARALGVTNALAKAENGVSFNTFYGPSNVSAKQFDAIQDALYLVDDQGQSVQGKFGQVTNILKTMKFETIASIGTNVCMLIEQAAYSIGTDSRYGDADAVVVSSGIAGYLAASVKFTSLSDKDVQIDSATGAKLAGTVGSIKVYVDVQIPENSPFVTVLRTNKNAQINVAGVSDDNLLVPGLAFIVKDLLSSTDLVPEGTGGKKLIIDTETTLVKIGKRPEAGYLTFAVDINLPGLQ